MSQSLPQANVPLGVRISLAHAYFQRILEKNSIDALHIKGYAFGLEVYRPGRESTDVDLLVRPAHVNRLIWLLENDGWTIQAHFETGSIFEHAATLYHPTWGLTDIHRLFPGLGKHKEEAVAFDRLWASRRSKTIAETPCWVPSLTDCRMLVVLHSAKDSSKYLPDIVYLKETLAEENWEELWQRAQETNSEIAFAKALGNLESYRNHPEYLLWKSVAQGTPDYLQWWARIKLADNIPEKVRILLSIFEVNRDHLAMELGHKPSHNEIRTRFYSRFSDLIKGGGRG